MEKNTTGRFLSTLRKAKGMTQRELAELLNVSDKAVSRWERDESMPDILLLPILADIFEVSCDDLLRGERTVKEIYQETPEKQMKRMQSLIQKSKSKFQAYSLISTGVALLCFLIAIVLNFSYKKATVGFFCALFGIIAGVICQSAFYIYYSSDVDTEGLQGEEFNSYKKYIRDHSVHIFCFLGIIFFICLPLLLFGQVSYADYIAALSEQMAPMGFESSTAATESVFPMGSIPVGLQLKTWTLYGGIGAIFGIIVSYIVNFIMKFRDAKYGRFGVTETDIKKSKISLLHFLKYFVILIVLLGATFIGSKVFEEKMPNILEAGTQFDNFEDFKEYMETVPDDMHWGVVELRQQLDKYKGTVYGDDGELLCEYRILNDSVIDIEFGNNNKLPITVYSENDHAVAVQKTADLMWIWTVIMIAETIIVIFVYFVTSKRKFHKNTY